MIGKSTYMKASLIVLAVIVLLIATYAVKPAVAQEKGPYLNEIVMVQEPDSAKAFKRIEAGQLDLYLWYLKGESARAAVESPSVGVLKSYAGVFDLFVNPVPFKGKFNPFTIREVREALNWLIDRDYIADEILKGYAIPQYTVWQPVSPDYARHVVYMKKLEAQYKYNPDKAKETIKSALLKAGAELKDGKWYYKGKPIEVTIFIRVEDERKQIGEYVAGLLEDLGFTVKREYGTGYKAWLVVYSGDPTSGAWNLYTEGWAFTAITAYDDGTPEYMFVSPGSGSVFTKYKPPKELVDEAKRLSSAKYTSLAERSKLVDEVTGLGLADSVRVWLVTQITVFPHSKRLTNIAYDLIGGVYSIYTLRTAKIAGQTGGSIKVAQKVLFVSPWSTAPGESGFTWLYDAVIRYITTDPGVYIHPHTGEYIPVRADFTVETAGPTGKLPVPANAIKWDEKQKKWVDVGSGVKATSKVTFKYTMGKWHDNTTVTMADILEGIATDFEALDNTSKIYDPYLENPALRTFIDTFVAIRIVSSDTAEVYINYWHPDKTYIAAQADVWEDTPWELEALMNWVVENKKAAFTGDRAQELGVPVIDLAKGKSLPILKEALDTLKGQNYIPPEVKDFVNASEAAARWQALENWYGEYGHLYVSNGPFYLYKANPSAKQVTLKAFRQYPFPPDHWNDLVKPKAPEIALELPPIVTVGGAATFIVKSSVAGVPYSKVDMSYMVVDPTTGNILTSGKASVISAGTFAIKLLPDVTSKFTPGTYEMVVIGVGKEAALPRISSTTFTVLPSVKQEVAKQVGELEKRVSGKLSALSGSLASTLKDISTSIDKLSGTTSTVSSTVAKLKEDQSVLRQEQSTLSAEVAGLKGAVAVLQTTVYVVLVLVIIAIIVAFIRRK